MRTCVVAHSIVVVARRSGENSRISKEKKDLMMQPGNCWRITEENETAWKMRSRNYVNEM